MVRKTEKKYTLVMFGQISWDGLYYKDFFSRNGQVLKHFHSNERIEKIIYINPYFRSSRYRSMLKNFIRNRFSLCKIRKIAATIPDYDKVEVVEIINIKRFRIFRNYFYRRLKKVISKNTQCPPEDCIVWGYNPAEYRIFSVMPRARLVFDTVDNWIEMDLDSKRRSFYNKEEMKEGYDFIGTHSDILIISNGKKMTDFFHVYRCNHQNMVEVANGINADLFSPAKYEQTNIPPELEQCTRPIIGYVGVLQERFDQELFQYLLDQNPDFTFVLLGPTLPFRDFVLRVDAPNLLHIHQMRPYSDIPLFIHYFDVCIIPHVIDTMTNFMSPMKIYEYLAMNKPVVTTPVEGIAEVEEFCSIADTRDSFNQKIRESVSLQNVSSEKVLHSFSWSTKIEMILDVIENMVQEQEGIGNTRL